MQDNPGELATFAAQLCEAEDFARALETVERAIEFSHARRVRTHARPPLQKQRAPASRDAGAR